MYFCFLNAAGALTSSISFKGITSEAITQPETKVLSNESALYMSFYSTGMKNERNFVIYLHIRPVRNKFG